uniref:Uncharacterized protein n=1 Tax=Arundo donax TaxID=35708 RepID=A0A0A9GDY7_ARUDO
MATSSSRHRRVHVQLQHHMHLRLHPGCRPQHIPRGLPEPPRPADHGELPHLLVDAVAAGHDDGAAVVGERMNGVGFTWLPSLADHSSELYRG